MHDTAPMRAFKRGADFARVTKYLVQRQRALREPRPQRLAIEVLHHQEIDIADRLVPDVVEGADVRMLERGNCLRFPQEPRAKVGITLDLRRQNLQSDDAIEAGIEGFVNLAHAAPRHLLALPAYPALPA